MLLYNDAQWILSTLYNANRNENDTYRLFLTMRRYIYDNRNFTGFIEEITPSVLRFKPTTDVADDCFFSLSMFRPYIDARSKRRGSPGSEFYSRLGRSAFRKLGYPGIHKNWHFWLHFVQEHIVCDS